MSARRVAGIVALAVFASARLAVAQRAPARVDTVTVPSAPPPPSRVPPPDNVVGPVMMGLMGGLFGMFTAAHLARMGDPCTTEGCAWRRFGVALDYGWTIGVPLGAHLGNGRRGSLGRDMLVSAATAIVGRRFARATRDPELYVLMPLVQLVAVVGIERTTGEGRAPRDSVTCSRAC